MALDDADGLIAMAQMSAIELHAWGAREADPLHPDWVVFDLDPGEGVDWAEVVRSAHAVRDRLGRSGSPRSAAPRAARGCMSWCRCTPSPDWDWERVKNFCRAFAELMVAEAPERYVAHVKIADRHGRILIDWLRNAIGNTAIGSFCPRARPGAMVATPLAWDEVNAEARSRPLHAADGAGAARAPASRIRGTAFSKWISACPISSRHGHVKRHASPRCRPRIQRRAPASSSARKPRKR